MNVTPAQIELGLQIAAVAITLAWLYIALDRTRWWPSQWSLHLDASREPVPGEDGELVVVVPARNEAATLPRTLPRLLKQAPWFRQLVLVDDRSDDQTSSTVRRLAAETRDADKIHIERVDEVPEGWSGKVHAMQRGLEVATRDWDGDRSRQWILFTDADILHPTFSIGRIISKGGREEFDLVSVMVKLRARSFWEWLLIPPFVYFFQLLYPFRKVSGAGARRAAAAGGVVLVRRSVLEDAGGLEAIQNRAIDDVALAQRIRAAGGTCWLGLDPDMRSLRTYDSYGPVHGMVARTAFEQIGHHYVLLPIVWLGLIALFVAPPVMLGYGIAVLDPVFGASGAIAWVLSLANFLPVVQYLGAPSGFVLTLPIAALLYGFMTTASAWRYLLGRPSTWRDAIERDVTLD